MQAAQDRQKSYADRKRKPMEFEIETELCTDPHWKGVPFAGTLGGALSSPGNVKIRSNKNTHNSSQTGLRHLLQGLKL
ncbi:hypothetical protein Tco_1507764 [Tanacetum coccineum]